MISQLIDGELRELSDKEHFAQLVAQAHADGWDPCLRCFMPLADGACKPCATQEVFSADPDYRAWSDAQARLDFGGWAPESTRPYTYDDAQADKAIVAAFEQKESLAERRARMEPNACGLCGIPQRGHGQRYSLGHHGDRPRTYVLPTDGQRKARMTARRNVRTGRLAWASLNLGGAA